MATQTVTFSYQTGKTLTLKLYALGADTITATASATERVNQLGVYAAAFTDVAAGTYRAVVFLGTTPVYSGFVNLAATTATFEVDGLTAIGTAFLSTVLTKGTAGTIERAFWQMLKTQAVTDGTAVADAGNTVTQFRTTLTAPDGQYDHMILVFVSNGLDGEVRPIDTYVQANGVITLQEPLTEIPTGDEEFVILPQHAHPISEIQAGLATPDDLAVTIAPLSSSITARVDGTTISYYVGEVIAQTVAVTDSSGSAVDLSAKTLQVVIDSPKASHGDVQVIGSGSITVSGASNNQITFTNTAAVTATARTLRWALRDTANGDEVLAHGRVVVTEAAEED